MARTGMTLIYGVDMLHLVCNDSENTDQQAQRTMWDVFRCGAEENEN